MSMSGSMNDRHPGHFVELQNVTAAIKSRKTVATVSLKQGVNRQRVVGNCVSVVTAKDCVLELECVNGDDCHVLLVAMNAAYEYVKLSNQLKTLKQEVSRVSDDTIKIQCWVNQQRKVLLHE